MGGGLLQTLYPLPHSIAAAIWSNLPLIKPNYNHLSTVLPISVTAGRALRQEAGFIEARIINTQPFKVNPGFQYALTPEDAESLSNAVANGVTRNYAPTDRRTYATANGDNNMELDNKPVAIQPRARSVQDLPGGPNVASGSSNMPAVVLGGIVHAQTYEGARATAGTDAIPLKAAGPGVATASQTITGTTGPLIGATPGQSFAATANNGVRSASIVGAANAHAALSQAEHAVSYAHAERDAPEGGAVWDRQWSSRRLLDARSVLH